jgi:hypothetical protein
MRACSGGHIELSILLYKHNPNAIRIRNFFGETCLDLAGRSCNAQLVETLESMDRDENGSTGFFGAKMKMASSPSKKTTNEFAKPTAITLR